MRLLLAAMTADKGGVDANLEAHVALLERAAGAGCDLAVLPEMSLTGSIDPARHPERTLLVGSEPVHTLAAATGRTGVAAVFGIAERAEARLPRGVRGGGPQGAGAATVGEQGGGAFHITQVYARAGRVVGWYRKRHRGEGEEGYTPGTEPGVFGLAGVRFAVAVCAESGVDFPWRDAAAAGASLVLLCAAPGLDGRRRDEAGWRDGYRWWAGEGLGDAVRHARELGLWVAMATQAGSTEDEDFPGLAALVRPDGEVAARLPDWRPGTLVVDVPVRRA